jgi:prevent-host-death family protein
MPTVIGAYEAKTRFSELLARAEKGESFLVTKNGKPIAQIAALTSEQHQASAKAAGERILARLDARNRGDFDFDVFRAEFKQEQDEEIDRWLSLPTHR